MNNRELKQLVDDYQPTGETLKKLQTVNLITVVGASASGKTTLMQMLSKARPEIKLVGGDTSRPPRPDEKNSQEYAFRNLPAMVEDLKKGRYVQVVMMPSGDLYGTRLSDYPVGGTGIMAVLSHAIPLFRQWFGGLTTVFIVPASYEAWQGWFSQRQITAEGQLKRLKEARDSYESMLKDSDVNFILNDNLDDALRRLLQIVNRQKPADEPKARKIAQKNLAQLKRQLSQK